MLVINFKDFVPLTQISSKGGLLAQYSVTNYAGRTVLTYTGGILGYCELRYLGGAIVDGGNSLSDATRLRPVLWDTAFAFPTLSTATDYTAKIAYAFFSINGNDGFYIYLYVTMSSGVATLWARATINGTTHDITFGTVAAGSTYYRVTFHVYEDLIKSWFDGVANADEAIGDWDGGQLFANGLFFFWDDPDVVKAVWAYERFGVCTTSYDATLGESETEGHPDDGYIWAIAKADLYAAVTGGDTFLMGLTDGVFDATDLMLVDGDYLLVKLLAGNEGGFAKKIAIDTGDVIEGTWEEIEPAP